jgi:hypothetical protein
MRTIKICNALITLSIMSSIIVIITAIKYGNTLILSTLGMSLVLGLGAWNLKASAMADIRSAADEDRPE